MIVDFLRALTGIVVFILLVFGLNVVGGRADIRVVDNVVSLVNLNIVGLSAMVLAGSIGRFLKGRMIPVRFFSYFFTAFAAVYALRFALVALAVVGWEAGVDYRDLANSVADLVNPLLFAGILLKGWFGSLLAAPKKLFSWLKRRFSGGGKKR